jgi:hypothetical protein
MCLVVALTQKIGALSGSTAATKDGIWLTIYLSDLKLFNYFMQMDNIG